MKSRAIILIITLCTSIVSCTNKQKQQNTIIGGADGTTEITIAEDNSKQDRDTLIYEIPQCQLWYTKELSVKHRENGWYRIIDGQKDSITTQPVVTVKEFVGLQVDKDFFGKPVIAGNVSKHKLQAWADSTEQLVGKRMGFVFNDSVITAPRVNMRLESGTFQITTSSNYDMPSLYRNLLKEKKDSLDVLFKANGWEKDTLLFNQLNQEKQDSIINTLDYIDACSLVKGFENN